MRSLILGATGLVGSYLVHACAARGFAHLGTWYRCPHPDHVPLDLRDGDAVEELLADYQPDIIFLAAGPSCSVQAEANRTESHELMVGGTRVVAGAVARHGGTARG